MAGEVFDLGHEDSGEGWVVDGFGPGLAEAGEPGFDFRGGDGGVEVAAAEHGRAVAVGEQGWAAEPAGEVHEEFFAAGAQVRAVDGAGGVAGLVGVRRGRKKESGHRGTEAQRR